MTKAAQAGTLIAGAGIGGLAAALALHARGLPVTLLEAEPELRPLGAGVTVQPAAVAALIDLGLGEAVAAGGVATREHRYLDHRGATLWSEPRGLAAGHRAPQFSIHGGELRLLLLDAVRARLGADAVRTGTRVRGFDHAGDRVRVHTVGGERGERGAAAIEAAVLVGADGPHSAVRARLHPDEPPARTTAVRAWRGLSELPGFIDGRTVIIASDEQGNRLVASPCSRRHAERGSALLDWVCLAAGPAPADERPPGGGRLAELLRHFAHWDFGWLDLRATLAASPEIRHHPTVERDPLPSWGERRVTLLGDAAHPMDPVGANGATQAILDGVALAAHLSAGADDPAAALARYEAERLPATTAIVRAHRTMDRSERALAR